MIQRLAAVDHFDLGAGEADADALCRVRRFGLRDVLAPVQSNEPALFGIAFFKHIPKDGVGGLSRQHEVPVQQGDVLAFPDGDAARTGVPDGHGDLDAAYPGDGSLHGLQVQVDTFPRVEG